jgi:hypothetical protein
MAVEYKANSPYYKTALFGNYLDVLNYRAIPKTVSDVVYVIDAVYERRPDLLANDLYGDPNLWWVFAARNPNMIEDPIFDFVAGRAIYIPKQETIDAALGI